MYVYLPGYAAVIGERAVPMTPEYQPLQDLYSSIETHVHVHVATCCHSKCWHCRYSTCKFTCIYLYVHCVHVHSTCSSMDYLFLSHRYFSVFPYLLAACMIRVQVYMFLNER